MSTGFSVVYIVFVIAILSGGALIISSSIRGLASQVADHADKIQDLLSIEAGQSRARFALKSINDPMRQDLLSQGGDVSWRFFDHDLRLAFRPEGGRIDLNFASPELLGALFRSIARSPGRADQWLEEVVQRRAARTLIKSVSEIVSACEYLGNEGLELRSTTTVWTKVQTVDPRWIDGATASKITVHTDAELRSSLSSAMSSPFSFSSDRYVNIAPQIFRLTVFRASGHGLRESNRSTIWIQSGHEGLREFGREAGELMVVENLC